MSETFCPKLLKDDSFGALRQMFAGSQCFPTLILYVEAFATEAPILTHSLEMR